MRSLTKRQMFRLGQGLKDLTRWPAEPASPQKVELRRFAAALDQLCGGLSPRVARRTARWLISSARKFDVDPFLLAALIYRQSRCRSASRPKEGVGLARIRPELHRPFIRRNRYTFWVLEQGRWQPRTLNLRRARLKKRILGRPRVNIPTAAALLSMYTEQCPEIDAAFGSVPHRHPVSHMIWGDRVRCSGPEDRVLTARRRMLQYYRDELAPVRALFGDTPLHCPLDGPPRIVYGAWGDDRAGGRRLHEGVDFVSTTGEPVRAIADGVVTFAGTQISRVRVRRGRRRFFRRRIGAGGRLVIIAHGEELRSGYMHLLRYVVKRGERVTGGQLIGYVGRSGIKSSDPHLHFELRIGRERIDPSPHLKPYIFLPSETPFGQRVAARQEISRQRRRERRARWLARRAKRQAAAARKRRLRRRRAAATRRRASTKKSSQAIREAATVRASPPPPRAAEKGSP